MHDAGSPPGARRYWRTHYMSALSDDAIGAMVAGYSTVTSRESIFFLWHLHGAFKQVAAGETAYPHRDANYAFGVVSQWLESEEDDRHVRWARSVWDAVRPFSTGGIYANFTSEVGPESVSQAFGGNLARLGRVKGRYDPGNFFRCNLNISPTA